MANEVKRIYAPFTKDLCVSTPHAMVDGNVSYLPIQTGKVDVQLITDVQNKGGIVDHDYSILARSTGHAEQGQIELTLTLSDAQEVDESYTYAAKETVKLGVNADSMQIFPTATTLPDGVEVGGTYGEATLDIITQLAARGSYLMIRGMHIDADDQKHFTAKMVEKKFKHDGSSAGDRNILYPKALASDEQTTIRAISEMNVALDGFNYIDIPVYRGVEANMTLETTYVK